MSPTTTAPARSRRFRGSVLGLLALVLALTWGSSPLPAAGGTPSAGEQLARNINTLVSNLPILPPERASRPFDSTLKISGLPVEKFLILMSKPPFLDMNLVIATTSKALEAPVEMYLNEMTVGEAFNLVLQLNNLSAVRFNEKTLIITSKDEKKTFGIKQRKTYHLTYFMPSKLVEFVEKDPFLKDFFKNTNFIPNDVQRNVLVIGMLDEMTLVDYIIALLDQKPNKIHARIPISNIEFDDLKTKLEEMLPEDIASSIDTKRWVYSEKGRSILVYDDPTTVELLKKLIAGIDIPPKQVLIDIALMEVTSNFTRDIGMKLGSSSFTVDSLDKLFSLSRLRRHISDTGQTPAPVSVSYLLQQTGGRTLASPKVRCLDNESADINIGEIRNIRVQSTEFSSSTGGTTQQSTFQTQEVPIGVQLNVKPEVHNDGTVTLELTIADEAVLQVQDYGVDRTTRNSTTKLRIRDGETVIMGGFINQNREYDQTPIPLLGELPLIGRLFRAGKRSRLSTELVFLITPYILDFEKTDERSFAKKTLDDIKPGQYTEKGLADATIKSQTVRWVEDKETKTKIIVDASGRVVYQQTWSKETGEPIGAGLDLRSEAERTADGETIAGGPAPDQGDDLDDLTVSLPGEEPAPTKAPVPAPPPVAVSPVVPPAPAARPPVAATPSTAPEASWDDLLEQLDDAVKKNG